MEQPEIARHMPNNSGTSLEALNISGTQPHTSTIGQLINADLGCLRDGSAQLQEYGVCVFWESSGPD